MDPVTIGLLVSLYLCCACCLGPQTFCQILLILSSIGILTLRVLCYPCFRPAREERLYEADEISALEERKDRFTNDQSGLKKARERAKQELDLKLRQLQTTGSVFRDETPHAKEVLEPTNPAAGPLPAGRQKKELQWERAEKFMDRPTLFGDGPDPNDVGQGGVGDCYFLAALAAVAEKPTMIRDLFVNDTENAQGCYGVLLAKHGQWEVVWVDDCFPVASQRENPFLPAKPDAPLKPLFVHSNDTNKLWPLLMEKAWVLLYGQGEYENVSGGFPYFSLHALTMCPTLRYESHEYTEREMWEVLNNTIEGGCIMSAGCYEKPFFGIFTPPCCRMGGRCCRIAFSCCAWCEWFCLCLEASVHCMTRVLRCIFMPLRWLLLLPLCCCSCCFVAHGSEFAKKPFSWICTLLCGEQCSGTSFDGIVSGHAYTVLATAEVPTSYGIKARIVKLRNPYGKKEWKGLFSDGSCAWTEEARELVGHEKEDEADDGVFWMHLADFMSFFQVIAVCYSTPGKFRTLDKRIDGDLTHPLCLKDDAEDDFDESDDELSSVPFLGTKWFVSSVAFTAKADTEQSGVTLVVREPSRLFVTVVDHQEGGDGLRGVPICASGKQWALVVWDDDMNEIVAKNLARDLKTSHNCLCCEEWQHVDRQFTFLTSMSTTQIKGDGRFSIMVAWPDALQADENVTILVHSTSPVSIEDFGNDIV